MLLRAIAARQYYNFSAQKQQKKVPESQHSDTFCILNSALAESSEQD
jgi:hypothetical protein